MKSPETIFRFRVTLRVIEPPIWRVIDVPSDCSFWDLHRAIQCSMGWLDCHLHCFRVRSSSSRKPVLIGLPDVEMPCLASKRTKLRTYLAKPGASAVYEYDFGDGWEHTVTLEGVLLAEPGQAYPRCVTGERKGPPEDVGGSGGYEEFLKAIGSKRHPEHRTMLEWYGGPYDPEEFHPESVRFDAASSRKRKAARH